MHWQNIILPAAVQPAFEVYLHLKSATRFFNSVVDMLLGSLLPNVPLIPHLPNDLSTLVKEVGPLYIMISVLSVYYFNFKMSKYIIGYFSVLQICKLRHDFDRFKLTWLGLHLTLSSIPCSP